MGFNSGFKGLNVLHEENPNSNSTSNRWGRNFFEWKSVIYKLLSGLFHKKCVLSRNILLNLISKTNEHKKHTVITAHSFFPPL